MPNNEQMTEISAQQVMHSPIGKIAIGATPLGVCRIEILTNGSKSEFATDSIAAGHCSKAASQLQEYFAGTRREFEVKLDLSGTDFQKGTWNAISTIGFGQVASYRDLAEQVGKPLAARAVGGAVGSNPVPLIIGCHRILGTGGRITGYSGGEGLKTKRWLLNHEGIEFKDE